MKITKEYLKQVIKEELERVNEGITKSELFEIIQQIDGVMRMPNEKQQNILVAVINDLESKGYNKTASYLKRGKLQNAIDLLQKTIDR